MSLLIPQPIKSFNRKLAIYPALTFREPSEGKMILPLELDWDGAGSTFDINVAAITTQPFSQIVMLDVDNTQSGADVQFIFPDTQDTLTVPAYEAGTFPVFTGGRLFYVAAPMALASDITRVRVLNYRQEPVANPSPEFHNAAASNQINFPVAATPILAATISGTLVGYSIFVGALGGAGGGSAVISLKDHTAGTLIDNAPLQLAANGVFNGFTNQAENFAYRFAGGIDVIGGATGSVTGSLSVNLKYRTP